MAAANYKSPWMNDELREFRGRVRHFIRQVLTPRQATWRQEHRPDAEAWVEAGRAGILLTDIPEKYGGAGGTFAHESVVIEELVQAGVQFGSIVHSVVAHYLLGYGTDEQKRQWLPRMARGELVGAIAMSEPTAGSDLQGIKTTARRDGGQYVINGSKMFITNASHAGLVCAVVKTDSTVPGVKGISIVVVETKDLPGYRVGPPLETVGLHAQDTCEVFFNDVRVPASNLLGTSEGRGFSQMTEQLAYERLAVSVRAVATTEQAVGITTQYVKERTAFGKPLIDLQNTRFKIAECRTEAQVGRVFLDNCVARFIAGELDTATVAMAKYWLTDRQCRVVDECVQLHGGYGYLLDNQIARMWVDSRAQRLYAGTNEVMKEMIAWSL